MFFGERSIFLILCTPTSTNRESLFSIIYQVFQQLFRFCCTASILKLLLQLVGVFVMETLESHQPFIKVGLVLMLSYQFYYTYENCKYCMLQQTKEQYLSMLILLLKFGGKSRNVISRGKGGITPSLIYYLPEKAIKQNLKEFGHLQKISSLGFAKHENMENTTISMSISEKERRERKKRNKNK